MYSLRPTQGLWYAYLILDEREWIWEPEIIAMIWEYFFIQFSPCSAWVALFATDVLGDWVFMCALHSIANLMSHRGGLPRVGGWTISHATYPGVTKNPTKSHGRDPWPTPPELEPWSPGGAR